MFVVNKANLIAAVPTLTVTSFRNLAAMWGPQGVQNDDPGSTEGYFSEGLGIDAPTLERLRANLLE